MRPLLCDNGFGGDGPLLVLCVMLRTSAAVAAAGSPRTPPPPGCAGGVVSNNSSGMCCGVSQNTYHTLRDMRVVFTDGTLLDTADPMSRESFLRV